MLTRPVLTRILPGWGSWRSPGPGIFSFRLVQGDDPVLATNHRLNVLNGMAAMVAINLSVPFYAIYAERLGATNFQIALLTSLPAVMMALLALPSAGWVERVADKRRLIVPLLLLARLLVLALLAAPYLPGAIPPLFVVLIVALAAIPGTVVTVAWQSLMGDLFPAAARAEAFAIRARWMGWTGLAAVLGAGVAIDSLPYPFGYQLIFLLSGFFGIIETYYLSQFRIVLEPGAAKPRAAAPSLRGAAESEWRRLQARPHYLRYVGVVFFFHFAWMALWPVFTVYKLETLHANNTWMSLYSVTSTLGSILTYRHWSRQCSLKGNGWVVGWNAFGLTLIPVVWVLFAKSLPVSAILDGFGGIVVGGFNLALFNQWLDIADPKRRPTDMAYLNTVVQLAAVISPLVGMAVYEQFGFVVAMLAFAAVRVAASYLLLRVGLENDREAGKGQ